MKPGGEVLIVKPGGEVLAAQGIGFPIQVSLEAVFIEVVEPVGRIACPACTCGAPSRHGAGTGERSRRVGVGDDAGGGQGASLDGATACPAKRNETGLPTGS